MHIRHSCLNYTWTIHTEFGKGREQRIKIGLSVKEQCRWNANLEILIFMIIQSWQKRQIDSKVHRRMYLKYIAKRLTKLRLALTGKIKSVKHHRFQSSNIVLRSYLIYSQVSATHRLDFLTLGKIIPLEIPVFFC